ncbi:2'-5' RNA ligase family protein [Mucilaginibacter robiniae]|uniref:2'-5' RNA ligase family protein n=1 Tax=Mucilaginibacter robiniae TaxID=2728022 RepID=A0A7L5ECA6_9SPHI|nr:2'-5' RNA ligase family protein [Mucilaginibacter robiniae]QJD98036.1 2'-5' RNA ligase family protein [Mucilaginibacter robiniae]
MIDAPMILTLALDDSAQDFFNALRKEHFPVERNYLDAHLTLFHHLPPEETSIIESIEQVCEQYQQMQLQVTEVKSIGNGVAYQIVCTELMRMHKHLQQQWDTWLTPQDRQKLWPHVTIQNKVAPQQARLLKEQLAESFEPFTTEGTGLNLFAYQGGPWQFIKHHPFSV